MRVAHLAEKVIIFLLGCNENIEICIIRGLFFCRWDGGHSYETLHNSVFTQLLRTKLLSSEGIIIHRAMSVWCEIGGCFALRSHFHAHTRARMLGAWPINHLNSNWSPDDQKTMRFNQTGCVLWDGWISSSRRVQTMMPSACSRQKAISVCFIAILFWKKSTAPMFPIIIRRSSDTLLPEPSGFLFGLGRLRAYEIDLSEALISDWSVEQ